MFPLFDWVDHGPVGKSPTDLRVGEARCHTVHLKVSPVDYLLFGSLLLLLYFGRFLQYIDPQHNIVIAQFVTCNAQVVTIVRIGHMMNYYTAIGEDLDPGIKTTKNNKTFSIQTLYCFKFETKKV